MALPTLAQQRGLAYAPIPFAVLSFVSSSCVIYHLLCRHRQKLERMYHRLVLAMNFAILVMSFTWVWRPFAVPEGAFPPIYPAASGTIQTCTASGFLSLMFSLAVPTYYASLGLQAFLGIKNNFREEKYKWIEKWIHLLAYCVPCAISIVFAATENFNPSGSGCYPGKAPLGCGMNPDVPCTRGMDLHSFGVIVALILVFLYFVFPPSMMIAMRCWIGKVRKRTEGSRGMQKVRVSAQKQMMKSVSVQISVYLFSFWLTWIFSLTHEIYKITTSQLQYGLLILGNCMVASQGFVLAIDYFLLQRLGRLRVECDVTSSRSKQRPEDLTVEDIRLSVERKAEAGSEVIDDKRESYAFNIFDGVPDEDSPWARFLDQDCDYHSDNSNTPNDDGTP